MYLNPFNIEVLVNQEYRQRQNRKILILDQN